MRTIIIQSKSYGAAYDWHNLGLCLECVLGQEIFAADSSGILYLIDTVPSLKDGCSTHSCTCSHKRDMFNSTIIRDS